MTTGHRLLRKDLPGFDTMPCRHMPLLVHFLIMFLILIIAAITTPITIVTIIIQPTYIINTITGDEGDVRGESPRLPRRVARHRLPRDMLISSWKVQVFFVQHIFHQPDIANNVLVVFYTYYIILYYIVVIIIIIQDALR